MTSLLISIIFWILQQGAPNQISERNRLKADAERAFASRNYALAASLYQRLAQSALLPESAVLFNEAQSRYALNDTLRARKLYSRLTRADEPVTAATALSQLGVLTCRSGDSARALGYFELALRILPTYEPARYNYELLCKSQPHRTKLRPAVVRLSAERRPEPPRPQLSSRTALPSEKRDDVLEKLEHHQLTEQKARMLLDAMRAEEIQYIQQRRPSRRSNEKSQLKETW